MCMWIRAHVLVHAKAKARGDGRMACSVTPALHLVLLRQGPLLNLELTVFPGLAGHQLRGTSCLPLLPPVLGLSVKLCRC